jgi:hypothetical protein
LYDGIFQRVNKKKLLDIDDAKRFGSTDEARDSRVWPYWSAPRGGD